MAKTVVLADGDLGFANGLSQQLAELGYEAHTVDDERSFEQLRMLLNFQAEDRFLLTLLLVGQSELSDKVGNLKQLKQLDQRIGIRCHLKQLTAEETTEYIEPRLQVAGRTDNVFTKDAVDEIFERPAGIPRRINHLCDISLLTGFGHQAEAIDSETITAAAEQFGS